MEHTTPTHTADSAKQSFTDGLRRRISLEEFFYLLGLIVIFLGGVAVVYESGLFENLNRVEQGIAIAGIGVLISLLGFAVQKMALKNTGALVDGLYVLGGGLALSGIVSAPAWNQARDVSGSLLVVSSLLIVGIVYFIANRFLQKSLFFLGGYVSIALALVAVGLALPDISQSSFAYDKSHHFWVPLLVLIVGIIGIPVTYALKQNVLGAYNRFLYHIDKINAAIILIMPIAVLESARDIEIIRYDNDLFFDIGYPIAIISMLLLSGVQKDKLILVGSLIALLGYVMKILGYTSLSGPFIVVILGFIILSIPFLVRWMRTRF